MKALAGLSKIIKLQGLALCGFQTLFGRASAFHKGVSGAERRVCSGGSNNLKKGVHCLKKVWKTQLHSHLVMVEIEA